MAEESAINETVLIKFAQKLAGNEKKFRDRALKKLRKFLESRAQSPKGAFSEADFLKIWKGLHYCMWMADKPLVQEELASNLASLVKCFKKPQQAFLFIDVFFQTESREWFNIDRLRLDKFMMLIRTMFGATLELIKRLGWKAKFIKTFTSILAKGVVSANSATPDGLKFHIADIFMKELEKVGASELKPKQLELFLQPFIRLIMQTKSTIMLKHVLKMIFFRLVDYGMESAIKKQKEEKNEMEEEDEMESDEEEEDVFSESFIPIEVDLESLSKKLLNLASGDKCNGNNRKDIYMLVKTYQDLAAGILPEEEILEDVDPEDDDDIDYESAVERMDKFETKLMQKTGKKRKQKKEDASLEPPAKKSKEENVDEETQEVKKPKNKFKTDGDTKKKKGKEKLEKKKKVVKEAKPPKKELNIFSGGFFYDDNEDNNEVMENADLDNEILENDLTVENDSVGDEDVHLEIFEEQTSLKTKKLSKKKPKKLNGNEDSSETVGDLKEIGESTTPGSLKKKPKRKSLEVANGNGEVVSNGDVSLPSIGEEMNKIMKKKKKRQSLGDVEELMALKETKKGKKLVQRKSLGGSTVPVEETTKKQKKERRKSMTDLEEGEVEIWVPNKKYAGKMKGWFDEQQKSSLGSSPSSETDKGEELVSFVKGTKTPPAFIRRSLDKVSPKSKSPKSKKSQLSKVETPGGNPGSGKKRVSFIMSKNKMKALISKEALSPLTKYNPDDKPASPIIKVTENPSTPSPSNINFKRLALINTRKNTPKTIPLVHEGKVARFQASDFF